MIIVTVYHGKDWYDFESPDARVFDVNQYRHVNKAEHAYQKAIESHTAYMKGDSIPWFAVTYLQMDMVTGEHILKSYMDKNVQRTRIEFNKEAKRTAYDPLTAPIQINPWGVEQEEYEEEDEDEEEHN